MNELYLDGKILLIEKIAAEYADYVDIGLNFCPSEFVFKIRSKDENAEVIRSARFCALNEIVGGAIKKYAFDTRHINQETERNPRTNLQYWNRSDEFIERDDSEKLKIFAGLMNILNDIKNDLGKEPEWFESYSRVLYDTVERILRVKQGDLDIFRPQLSYLEQLVYARYRLNMENLTKMSKDEIRSKILSKDEALLKRGEYLKSTGGFVKDSKKEQGIIIDGKSTQENIVNAIFGNSGFRRDGEKNVERTITITIKDTVIE